ncbi:MAG: phytanoyl-CoA dioxygenase family protein [Crocinitomicaceae bacterium]|nr:phytanoyl-CoA dioxygenase family protein [Crocinitomicaceae bacterium]
MKTAIFKSEELQTQFERDGFAKLKLFDEAEINSLRDLFETYVPEDVHAFFSSSYLDDFELKSEMSNKIAAIIDEKVKEHFVNYRLIGAAFLVKGIGKQSEMPMHQDWTIVDESKYFAANVWIPLTATTETNGTIEVLKGSQNWNRALRAPTLPFFFEGHQERIRPSLTAIDANIGDVVVLNQAVIHYSKPNLSQELRPAITCGLISKEAPLKFHYWNKDTPEQIEVFSQKDDFLLRFEDFHTAIYERPTMGESKGMIDYAIPKIKESELTDIVGPPVESVITKPGFIARLFGRK